MKKKIEMIKKLIPFENCDLVIEIYLDSSLNNDKNTEYTMAEQIGYYYNCYEEAIPEMKKMIKNGLKLYYRLYYMNLENNKYMLIYIEDFHYLDNETIPSLDEIMETIRTHNEKREPLYEYL